MPQNPVPQESAAEGGPGTCQVPRAERRTVGSPSERSGNVLGLCVLVRFSFCPIVSRCLLPKLPASSHVRTWPWTRLRQLSRGLCGVLSHLGIVTSFLSLFFFFRVFIHSQENVGRWAGSRTREDSTLTFLNQWYAWHCEELGIWWVFDGCYGVAGVVVSGCWLVTGSGGFQAGFPAFWGSAARKAAVPPAVFTSAKLAVPYTREDTSLPSQPQMHSDSFHEAGGEPTGNRVEFVWREKSWEVLV